MTLLNENLDLSSPSFKKNAHEIYKHLRRHDPMHKITMQNGQIGWLITRYDDVAQALKDDLRITKDRRDQSTIPPTVKHLFDHLLATDPPDHTRLRSIVSKAFSPKIIESLHSQIQQITEELIDRIESKGAMDVIDDFAFPLPIAVLSRMLGIPEEEHYLIREWSNAIIAAASDNQKIKEALPSIEAFAEYIETLIIQRREKPADDLISHFVYAHDNGEYLTAQEVSSMIFLLIIAGHETTVNLIGNGLLALLENPDQLELFKKNPHVAPSPIEELLRYYSPVEIGTVRWAKHDFTWYEKTIHQDDLIFVSISSANRDPEQFEQPDRLDLTRTKNKHVAFGNGIHYCLGAPLARLEGKIALTALLRRLPNLSSAIDFEELTWRPGILMRGLVRFPVSF